MVAFVLFGFLAAIKEALVGGVALAGADRLIVRDKVSIINLLPVSYKARMDRIPASTSPRIRPGSAAFIRTRKISSCKIPSSRKNF